MVTGVTWQTSIMQITDTMQIPIKELIGMVGAISTAVGTVAAVTIKIVMNGSSERTKRIETALNSQIEKTEENFTNTRDKLDEHQAEMMQHVSTIKEQVSANFTRISVLEARCAMIQENKHQLDLLKDK